MFVANSQDFLANVIDEREKEEEEMQGSDSYEIPSIYARKLSVERKTSGRQIYLYDQR